MLFDYLLPLPDLADRLNKWKDATVSKATKAAEAALIKTLKKSQASVATPESAQQLREVMDDAAKNATDYFNTLTVPLHRLGSIAETTTARGKLMLAALNKTDGSEKVVKEREGVLKPKKKKAGNAESANKQSLLTLGKHLLK